MSGVRVWTANGIAYNLFASTSPMPEGSRFITEADHLAALERVRVETLREVWAAVNREQAWSLSDAQMQTKCLAAIDRLIDATTTGDTDA